MVVYILRGIPERQDKLRDERCGGEAAFHKNPFSSGLESPRTARTSRKLSRRSLFFHVDCKARMRQSWLEGRRLLRLILERTHMKDERM